MFKISSIVIKQNDTYTTVSGEYSGSSAQKALNQHKAHAHKLYGYKLYLRNTVIEEVQSSSN